MAQDWTKLQPALIAAGLPVAALSVGADPNKVASGPYNTFTGVAGTIIGIDWTTTPTGLQITSAGSIITAFDPTPKVPRTMFAISADIFALTGALPTPAVGTQKAKIILDMFTGNVATGSQRWQQDAGPNAAALSAVYASLTAATGLTTFNAAQQLIMAAMFTQDVPGYLVNPSFDATINIPGDQPG